MQAHMVTPLPSSILGQRRVLFVETSPLNSSNTCVIIVCKVISIRRPFGLLLLLHGPVAHFNNKEITMNEEMPFSYVLFGVGMYVFPILVIGSLVCTLLAKVVAFVM